MAYCITSQWDSYAPQVKLTVVLDTAASDGDTAVLNWTLQYVPDGYAANTSTARSYTVKINGSTVGSGTYDIDGKKAGPYTIASSSSSGNKPVSIAKGTAAKSVSFSVSFAFNLTWSGTYCGTKTASGSITIPAKTSYKITYNANGGTGAPSAQTKWYGTALTLSSTKPTRAGHTFMGWATSASATSATYKAGASYTANAAATLYAVWQAYTYKIAYNANGGTGAPSAQTKTYGKTLTLSTTKPTRTNYTFKGWGKSASATAVAYAPGASYTTNAAATLYAVWELSYTKPKISNFAVARCEYDASTLTYSASETGTYGYVVFNWSCSQTVSSIAIKWEATGIIAQSTTVSASGTSGTVKTYIGGGSLSTDASYTVYVTVTDGGGSTTLTRTLSGTKFAIDFLSGGTGVAVGKPAELSGYFDNAFKTRFREAIRVDNAKTFYGTTPEGDVVESLSLLNTYGNLVIGYGNYDRGAGNTNIYGYDVHIGVSNCSDTGYYRPYCRKGDTIIFNDFKTAGYVTNSGKDVSFTVPFAIPIIGKPTITVSSVRGLVLRQGNSYTHGSGASAFTIPDSYSANVYPESFTPDSVTTKVYFGVCITAKFTDTTNVTNNDAIGIYWNGTITFS